MDNEKRQRDTTTVKCPNCGSENVKHMTAQWIINNETLPDSQHYSCQDCGAYSWGGEAWVLVDPNDHRNIIGDIRMGNGERD